METIGVFVGGVNMSLGVWLLQFKPLNEIAKDLGFTLELFNDKKSARESNFKITLPDRKILAINISNSKNAKVIKALCIDLQVLCNRLARYGVPFDIYDYDKESEYIQLFASNKKNIAYKFDNIKKYIVDRRTADILKTRGIEPNIYDVSLKCAEIAINDYEEDRLSVNNINLRLMDMIPTEIEKAVHYAISEYKRRRLINPDAKLVVNSGWVINKLREQSVLLQYKDGNMTIENSQLTGARLVGPGGFGKVDTVQIKDRNIVADHFGTLDCVDTAEGNPGVQLSLSVGFEYDPKNAIFSQVKNNNSYKNMFGTAVSQVPFSSSDDGNRLQFGGSQGKQVVPIQGSEVPLVGTGMEAYLPSYSSEKFIKRSPVDGKVTYVDD